MKKFVLLVCILFIATCATAMEDTAENRTEQAKRYLQATPPKAMFEDMAEKVAYNLPPKNREEFKAIFTKKPRYKFINSIYIKSIDKQFYC